MKCQLLVWSYGSPLYGEWWGQLFKNAIHTIIWASVRREEEALDQFPLSPL